MNGYLGEEISPSIFSEKNSQVKKNTKEGIQMTNERDGEIFNRIDTHRCKYSVCKLVI